MTLNELESTSATPCLIKVAAGTVPSSQLLSDPIEKPLLLHSISTTKKVICSQSTVNEENRKSLSRFSIPMDYKGYFEVLSENGESVKPLSVISDVANLAPEKFLVRSHIDALTDVKDGRSKTPVSRGTVLKTLGTVRVKSKERDTHYLHCCDVKIAELHLYIEFNTSGLFSPLAGAHSIAGVHSISSLVNKFRLPVSVRVVSGKVPVKLTG